jgi:hypothetical protein
MVAMTRPESIPGPLSPTFKDVEWVTTSRTVQHLHLLAGQLPQDLDFIPET